MDTLTPDQRRRAMQAGSRGRDTKPELVLRRALWAAGVRGYRLHRRDVPGRPDLAWLGARVAVFVDGAFWHGHPSKYKAGQSGEFWDAKVARNVARDREVDALLEASGWRVIRVWDFAVLKDTASVVHRIADELGGVDPRSG